MRGTIILVAFLLTSPAFAGDGAAWEAASKTACADAKWSVTSTPGVWDAVGDQADLIGLHQVCMARLVWAECKSNPTMTVGQALASIYYKIAFNKKLPTFQCGA